MSGQGIDRALAARWIAALESGAYAQGERCLRDHDGRYCCLGVACDASGDGQWERSSALCRYSYVTADGRAVATVLPPGLAARLGLALDGKRAAPWVFDGRVFRDLAAANDAGVPFAAVAAALRAHYGLPADGAAGQGA